MPVETLITRDGPVAAPLDYVVPAAAEMIPLVLSATFKDPTNAGPYIPCVEVITPQGVIIGPFPLGQSIAAGASARVSWFQGIAAAGTILPNTGGTWVSYTPVWTESSGVQPSIGNGTLTGLYYQLGKFVVARIELRPGTTTTYGNSTGVWQFSLPTGVGPGISGSFGMSANSSSQSHPTGPDVFTWGFQVGAIAQMSGFGYSIFTATIQYLNATQPVTWQAGDIIRLACMYEAA